MPWYVYDRRTQMNEFEAAFKEEQHARQWVTDQFGLHPDFIILTKNRIPGFEPKYPAMSCRRLRKR